MITFDRHKKNLDSAVKYQLASVLEQYGFSYKGVLLRKTEATPKWYFATFVNKAVGRYVEVTYIPKDKGPREVFSLCIREINPKVDEWDYTSLNSMKIPGKEIWELDGELLGKLKCCISSRLGLLQSEYLSVLRGENFETDHFDWGGMK